MKRFPLKSFFAIVYIMLVYVQMSFAQSTPQGFLYETNVRNSSFLNIVNQSVSFRFSLYSGSPSGTLVWQEDHSVLTDNYGHVSLIIGSGLNTGGGSAASFDMINWSGGVYYLKVSLDISGGSFFLDQGNAQLFSVPYALKSLKTSSVDGLSMGQLEDVDLTGNSTGKLLKWNGSYWVPESDNDSDTVLFAFSSTHSTLADTATYTFGISASDSILFAYNTDSSVYSGTSFSSTNSNTSTYSDTANYALASASSAWLVSGNTIGSSLYFVGNIDNSDLIFKTNGVERVSVKSGGNLLVGLTPNLPNLNISGNDGLFSIGALNSAYSPTSGAGTKLLWYPSKAAFRVGGVTSNQWDDSNIGIYSTSVGFDTKARFNSFCSGYQCQAFDYSIAMGRKSQANATKAYPYGNSIALGDSCVSNAQRSVAIGCGNQNDSTLTSNISSSVAIGYKNRTRAGVTTCLGSYCSTAVGANWSTAIGYHASANHIGSFVFSDASSDVNTASTAAHQFLLRANGGVIFYTDSLNTMGVALSSGSGSWASVSDKNKKENFLEVDCEYILSGIDKLKIRSWNYKSESKSIRHIGPMAQDFYRIFQVGENNRSISTVDIDGVILSGIKGLNKRIVELQNLNEVDELQSRIEKINFSTDLNLRLDRIEAELNKK